MQNQALKHLCWEDQSRGDKGEAFWERIKVLCWWKCCGRGFGDAVRAIERSDGGLWGRGLALLCRSSCAVAA